MPIIKNGSGTLVETGVASKDQFDRTGVILDGEFAICDEKDRLKQLQFDTAAQATNSVTTLKTGAASGNITLTLPSTTGTLGLAGAAANAFTIVQPDLGTSPTADNSNDTLTLTSSNSTITVTGDATTDSINLQAREASNSQSGIVSTGAQDFDGDKSFYGQIFCASFDGLADVPFTVGASVVDQLDFGHAGQSGPINLHAQTNLYGNLVLQNHSITQVADPTGSQDAVTLAYLQANPLPPIATRLTLRDDFVTGTSNSALGWGIAGNGAYTQSQVDGNHPGVVQVNTGGSSTGAGVYYIDAVMQLGGGAVTTNQLIKLSALSSGTQTYTVRIGFGDTLDGSDFNNGCYFEYTDGTNSGNWVLKTANNGTRTSTNSSIAATGATWIKLSVVVNAAATSVGFYVDGVLAGTNTTNIPGSPRFVGYTWHIKKSVGTTQRFLYTDYFDLDQTFTSAR